jgi:hypothetical protein
MPRRLRPDRGALIGTSSPKPPRWHLLNQHKACRFRTNERFVGAIGPRVLPSQLERDCPPRPFEHDVSHAPHLRYGLTHPSRDGGKPNRGSPERTSHVHS